MNERIKELMEQAGLYDFVIEAMGINEEMEKFAELIVKECIDYCGENLSKTVGGALKIHFGVE
jgi:hypothetical protein